MWLDEVAKTLSTEFSYYGYDININAVNPWLFRIMAWYHRTAKSIRPFINKETHYDNANVKELLGFVFYYDLDQSLREMGYSLIKHGIVQDKLKK